MKLRVFLVLSVVCLGVLSANAAPSSQARVLTFAVQRVTSLLDYGVFLVPEEELRRQIPDFAARLYGVQLLPESDPYRRAWNTVFAKVMRPPITAQVWDDGSRRVVRLAGYVDGKWSDLNGQLVREGVAVPIQEGSTLPYRTEAVQAERTGIGRYAYRHVAWFWANSTPMYAITATPSPGLRVPVAVAMVSPTRIEAGYLYKGQVILLSTNGYRLGMNALDVRAAGPDLHVTTSSWTPRALTILWRWNGQRYKFVQAAEK